MPVKSDAARRRDELTRRRIVRARVRGKKFYAGDPKASAERHSLSDEWAASDVVWTDAGYVAFGREK